MEFTMVARTNVIPVVIEHDNVTNTYHLTATDNDVIGLKTLNLDPREHPVVGAVESGMPAAAAGLQAGDKILSVNGISVPSQSQMIELIPKSEDKPCKIVFYRKNEKKAVTITPQYDPATKRARIGIVFSAGVYEVEHPTPWAQVKDVCTKMIHTFNALAHSKQTGVGAKDLTGPVGILAMLASEVNSDYRLALEFPGVAQHQPRHHQFAADSRARRRPHSDGHHRKNLPPALEPQICRIHHDRLCDVADFASCFTSHFWRHQTVCALPRDVQQRACKSNKRRRPPRPRRRRPNNPCATANHRFFISGAKRAKSSSATRTTAGSSSAATIRS